MKKLLALMLTGLLMFSVVGCGETQADTIDKVLTVALDCYSAPYSWTQTDDTNGAVPIKDTKQYANGYDVMIAKRICEANGWRLEVVQLSADAMLSALQERRVDCVMTGLSFAESEEAMECGPYYSAQNVYLIPKDGKYAKADSVEDLKGAVILSGKEKLDEVVKGNADALCLDLPTAETYAVLHEDVIMSEFSAEQTTDLGITLRKTSEELAVKINAVLQEMTKSEADIMMTQAIALSTVYAE